MKTAMMINTNLPLRASVSHLCGPRPQPTALQDGKGKTPLAPYSLPLPLCRSRLFLFTCLQPTQTDGQCKVEIERILGRFTSPRFPHVVKAIQETGGSGVHDSDDDEFRAQRERATRRRRRGRALRREGKGGGPITDDIRTQGGGGWLKSR